MQTTNTVWNAYTGAWARPRSRQGYLPHAIGPGDGVALLSAIEFALGLVRS